MKAIIAACAWFIACAPDPKYYLIDSHGEVLEIFSDPISCEKAEQDTGAICYTVQ